MESSEERSSCQAAQARAYWTQFRAESKARVKAEAAHAQAQAKAAAIQADAEAKARKEQAKAEAKARTAQAQAEAKAREAQAKAQEVELRESEKKEKAKEKLRDEYDSLVDECERDFKLFGARMLLVKDGVDSLNLYHLNQLVKTLRQSNASFNKMLGNLERTNEVILKRRPDLAERHPGVQRLHRPAVVRATSVASTQTGASVGTESRASVGRGRKEAPSRSRSESNVSRSGEYSRLDSEDERLLRSAPHPQRTYAADDIDSDELLTDNDDDDLIYD